MMIVSLLWRKDMPSASQSPKRWRALILSGRKAIETRSLMKGLAQAGCRPAGPFCPRAVFASRQEEAVEEVLLGHPVINIPADRFLLNSIHQMTGLNNQVFPECLEITIRLIDPLNRKPDQQLSITSRAHIHA
jgi:hypothetical protein